MDRDGFIHLRLIDEARIKGTIFSDIKLTPAALLGCILHSPFSGSTMKSHYFIYTLDHRKKKNLVASNFTERNFPITPADIHAICLEKTVLLCPVSSKEDVFDNCDLLYPDATDDIIDLVQSDSESTHSTQSDVRFSSQG
jgi:hypothetical protein